MTDPKRAAIEAQIAALMGELSADDAAPAPAASTATPVAATPVAAAPVAASAPATVATATANRHRVNAAPAPSPMFAKSARASGAKTSSPGMLSRARPTAQTAVPAAPAAGAAAPAAAPTANRQRPVIVPTAAARQLPRVMRGAILTGLPKPAAPRTPVGSSYMRAKPKVK